MLENILVNLKIISRIDEHQKISTVSNNDISIDSNDMLQGFRRYVWNDSREKTIKNIESIINQAIEYSKTLMDSIHLNVYSINQNPSKYDHDLYFREYTKLNNLSQEIIGTIKGLRNLQQTTYSDDVIVSSQLDILIQKIETHIAVIKKKLEDSQSKIDNT